jgi:hypothetical protein
MFKRRQGLRFGLWADLVQDLFQGDDTRRQRIPVAPWSLTSLRQKLIETGAKVVSHGRYVTFQMAEVAVPRQMFQEILSLIARFRATPAPA